MLRLSRRLFGSSHYLSGISEQFARLELELRDLSFNGNIRLCRVLRGESLETAEYEDAFKELEVSIPSSISCTFPYRFWCICSLYVARYCGLQLEPLSRPTGSFARSATAS